MADASDIELLRNYTQNGADDAFAGLVHRHIPLVYSAALRHVGIPAHAEEITQAVFIILAQKAPRLRPDVILEGWLYHTTRLAALSFRRGERRRQSRELEAYMQSRVQEPDAPPAWDQLAPLLDDAMSHLGEPDRQAILLRFFKGKNLDEVAAAMGTTEAAAQSRVHRAVEKLRRFFARRGVDSTASALTGQIAAYSIQATPTALTKTVTALAIAKGGTASASTLTLIKGALKIMAWSNLKTAIVGIVVVGLATLSVIQLQNQNKLREQNASLERQIAQLRTDKERLAAKPHEAVPSLPAPQIQIAAVTTNTVPDETAAPTNLWTRLKDPQKLTAEQIEAYLKANGRTASSLLAAFRTSGDTALLQEAMEKFPDDPQVAFEAVVNKDLNLSPDQQRQWLNVFKDSAPNNALADYLSALDYFNAGQIDQGVQDLSAASGKTLDDYTISRAATDREAYLAAGYSVADADALAASQLMLPQLAQMKQLGLDTTDLANAYSKNGDSASSQAVLQMAANLGQGYAVPTASESEISQLVGIYIERQALQAMDPNSSYGTSGQTVQDQLNTLTQQRTTLKTLDAQVTALMPQMSDQDWIIYENRWLMFGEQNAGNWVVNKYGQK